MKKKRSGKILDGGLCLCDMCGKQARLGGLLRPMSRNPQVVCYDCMMKVSAEEKGISVEAAEKQRNEAFRVPRLFTDCKMKEYLSSAGKNDFKDMDEVNKILQYVTNVWNTFDETEKGRMARKKDSALMEVFENVQMNWAYLTETPRQKPNDRCLCGSGRKYKMCCRIREERENAEIEQWKRFDIWVIRKSMVLIEACKELDFESLIDLYFGKKRLEEAKKTGMTQSDMEEFYEWMMHDYYAPDEPAPYVLSRMLGRDHLSKNERSLLEARIEAPKSLYAATFVKRGTGALLRNVFDREEVFVYDAKMSETVLPGAGVFSRIYAAGTYYLMSGGRLSYPPMYLEERRKAILKAYKKSGRTDGVNAFLRRNGHLFGKLL